MVNFNTYKLSQMRFSDNKNKLELYKNKLWQIFQKIAFFSKKGKKKLLAIEKPHKAYYYFVMFDHILMIKNGHKIYYILLSFNIYLKLSKIVQNI